MTKDAGSHSIFLRIFLPLIRIFARLIFLLFGATLWVKGRRNIPKKGALLVIANHLSNTDPVALQLACPPLVHFLARRELWEMKGVGPIVRAWRAIPISQSTADRAALKSAIESLKRDKIVAIFPEGQLSPDGKLLPLLPGVALIIRMSGAPCICAGIKGTDGVMPHPEMTPRWSGRPITVEWGEVRKFEPHAKPEEILAWIESELRRLSHQSPDG
ncbi:MAG: 1-acyl-sn-glycerol-3-phosphate acyltransferase [Fimbriimonadaceae bacterium]|jgi:1-acyl-sn-glycerol-3-phosphate acyltransferase|nr:1-acyl-sn-glycerol-3-phosphate acyltransferase [Fimbriimonadaceae bacterium]